MYKQKSNQLLTFLDDHSIEIIQKSSSTFIVKILGMIAGLFVSVFLGRTLGASGLGILDLSNKIVSILLVFSLFGTKDVLIKHISISSAEKNWQIIGKRIHTVTLLTSSIASILTIIGFFKAPFIANTFFKVPELSTPLQIIFIALLPQTLSRVFSSGLIGFGKIWQSNLVNETMSMWIVSLFLILMYLFNYSVDIIRVAIIYAIGRCIVAITVYLYWRKVYSFKHIKKIELRPVITMAIPLLIVSSTTIIAANADAIMTGLFSTTKEVGLYNVASKLALLSSLFLQVSNAAISPKIAAMYKQNRQNEIQKMVSNVTIGLMIIAISTLVFFVVTGEIILGVWGNEFKGAYIILLVLLIGQFFNVSSGCAGLVLVMCGYEKIHGIISVIFVLLNIAMNYILIKQYGALGAAIATALTVSSENITKLVLARKKTGILTLPMISFLYNDRS